MKRKICVITGTRADYGIIHPVMKAIDASKELNLCIIVTGMHLMKEFGFTYKEIRKDGFKVYKQVDTSYKEDTGLAMADSIGRAVSELSKTFAKLRPDVVVVLGDRGEMLAAAIAANYLGIPVAHIHGGEVSGHIDGQLRHAITKLSHIHFAATLEAKKRILKLGEEAWRVFLSGAPALDRILNERLPDSDKLAKKYSIDRDKPTVLLAQHPVLSEAEIAGDQLAVTLQAIAELQLNTILIYPNADAGGRRMLELINRIQTKSLIRAYKSIPHRDYLGLMNVVSVLVGNSSSGIIEAPSFKLPVVNIGSRQQGRERSLNIIDVDHDKASIIAAIRKALYSKSFRKQIGKTKNLYGCGKASRKIVKVLGKIKLDGILLEKQITY